MLGCAPRRSRSSPPRSSPLPRPGLTAPLPAATIWTVFQPVPLGPCALLRGCCRWRLAVTGDPRGKRVVASVPLTMHAVFLRERRPFTALRLRKG